MTDKEQILAEIIKMTKLLQDKVEEKEFIAGEVFMLNYLHNFINTMQEEPKLKFGVGDTIISPTAAVPTKHTIRSIYGNNYILEDGSSFSTKTQDQWELVENLCTYSTNRYTEEDRRVLCDGCEEDCVHNKEEKPSKKNFRERYKRIAQSDAFKKAHEGMSVGEVIPVEESSIPKIVDEHFWEMLGKEPVSEELKDYADKYAAETCHLMVVAGEYDDNSIEEYLMQACIDSANWQKQQMMKKAVDAKASYTMSVPSITISLPIGINVGDKVKVLVIKEE